MSDWETVLLHMGPYDGMRVDVPKNAVFYKIPKHPTMTLQQVVDSHQATIEMGTYRKTSDGWMWDGWSRSPAPTSLVQTFADSRGVRSPQGEIINPDPDGS